MWGSGGGGEQGEPDGGGSGLRLGFEAGGGQGWYWVGLREWVVANVSRVFVKSQFPLLRLDIKFSLRTCVKNT